MTSRDECPDLSWPNFVPQRSVSFRSYAASASRRTASTDPEIRLRSSAPPPSLVRASHAHLVMLLVLTKQSPNGCAPRVPLSHVRAVSHTARALSRSTHMYICRQGCCNVIHGHRAATLRQRTMFPHRRPNRRGGISSRKIGAIAPGNTPFPTWHAGSLTGDPSMSVGMTGA